MGCSKSAYGTIFLGANLDEIWTWILSTLKYLFHYVKIISTKQWVHFLNLYYNPLVPDVPKMVTLTITILQHLLQNCYCMCDHFVTSGNKGIRDLSQNSYDF